MRRDVYPVVCNRVIDATDVFSVQCSARRACAEARNNDDTTKDVDNTCTTMPPIFKKSIFPVKTFFFVHSLFLTDRDTPRHAGKNGAKGQIWELRGGGSSN
jgi:hypothetical protein